MMKIDWDVPITLADGLVLRADVFRPVDAGKYPVIISYGPYGKWLHFEDLYTDRWRCCSHRTSPPSASGKAPPTTTAISRITAGSSARSAAPGSRRRWCASSTAAAPAAIARG